MSEHDGYKVMWKEQKCHVPAGGTFRDVKKAFKWKNDVLMVSVDGKPKELMNAVTCDCMVEPMTFQDKPAQEALRHTAAHVMAQAVKRLFPEVKLAIGPPIQDGFYYDFQMSKPFTPDDLGKIEKEMNKIVKQNYPLKREELDRVEAEELFEKTGEPFKSELVEDIPQGEPLSIYRQGEFLDLCAGPHVFSTGMVKYFKLLSIAGAYWRGNEHKAMLQRIYGTVFTSREDLDAHLRKLEDIRRRDHRKIGKDLVLFSLEEEGGPGLVYWHPKGSLIREIIEEFWRKEHRKRGYELVYSPHIAKLDLWKTSGHLGWYKDSMYSPMVIDDVEYQLKPMNCPFHILIYKNQIRSYRDLPIKYGELGTVYRYERSGVLHGMLRVRGFTQDDAHIFCKPDQLEEELVQVLELAAYMLETFGYREYECMLSVRDPEDKSRYIGSDHVWAQAETALENALKRKGLSYTVDPGEAKFYGPAIDIKTKDAVGRMWQGVTIQVDFNLPERFDIHYIGEDGGRHRPVIIHRTVLGAMERFVGGLIEHYAGAFPLWLAPVQVMVLPISQKQEEYVREITEIFQKEELRVKSDLSGDKIGYKIRQAQLEKIPYMIIVGAKEQDNGTVTVRHRTLGDLGSFKLDEVISIIKKESCHKSLDSYFEQKQKRWH